MVAPVVQIGEVAHGYTYTQVFGEDFEQDGAGPGQYFSYDDLSDGLNRTGNEGQDASGTLDTNQSVSGKRWAAYTNGNNDEFVYRSGGYLYVGGKVENTIDPTRVNYSYGGVDYNWANIKPFAPYMVQWGRVYDNASEQHITDTSTPNIWFGPNHYVEIRLSVEQMKIPGFRVSLWLTPIIPNESDAYDSSAANGVEIDILEIENWLNGLISGNYGNNRVQQKVLAGTAGSTTDQGGGNIDASSQNIAVGFHTFGLLWLSTGLYFYIDGVESIRETTLVPQSYHSLTLSRELNAGVGGSNIPADGVKRPEDIGLYDVSSYPHLSYMDSDKAVVDYIRVFEVDGLSNTFNNPNVTGASSESPVSDPSQNTTGSGGGSGSGGTTGTGSGGSSDTSNIGSSTSSIQAIRSNEYIVGVDSMPDNDYESFKPRLSAGSTDPNDYTFSHSVSGDATIVGPSNQYEVVVKSGSQNFTLTSNVNLK